MLVLSRYRDESIYIGDDVVITIVDVRGDRVRLGIQAPSNVSVHRKEIYDAIVRERAASESEMTNDLQKKGKKNKNADPVEDTIPRRQSKGLPVDIDTPTVGFGGISDVVSQ